MNVEVNEGWRGGGGGRGGQCHTGVSFSVFPHCIAINANRYSMK